MITPKDHQVQTILLTCSLIALLMSSPLTAAIAQVVPPLNDPPPESTLTETTVTFTGGDAGHSGEQHWLSVETAPQAADIFHQSLGAANAQTVSGLPTSGTLYVRYWTFFPATGWASQSHTYTMNVSGGNGGGGTNESNHTLRWDRILNASNGNGTTGCNSDRFKCVLGGAAVLDLETGIVWERSPDLTGGPNSNGTRSWGASITHCTIREVGGRKGWHLPTVEQLLTLMDTTGTSGMVLPDGHPFNVHDPFAVWSATSAVDDPTTFVDDTTFGWVAGFVTGNVLQTPKTADFNRAWCARGGQAVDGYTHIALP